MKAFIINWGLPTLMLLSLIGCAPTQPQGPTIATPDNNPPSAETQPTGQATEAVSQPANFDRRAMLATIVETSILPMHEQFLAETEALQQAVHQFSESPTTEHLAQVQVQWQSTALAWARIEHLSFQFTMATDSQIKMWPVDTQYIEKFIVEETVAINKPYIQSIGATAKGLAAIEYLTFNPDLTHQEIAHNLAQNPRRMAYLMGLAENIELKSQELLALWTVDGENHAQAFIEADFSGSNMQSSISVLANAMMAEIEKTTNKGILYPRQGWFDSPLPEAVESRFARYSTPLVVSNLRGLQQTFNAGFADYLDFLQKGQEGERLSATINHQFDQTIAAVEAISPSLYVAVTEDPASVERAYEEVRTLLVLFKVDMANQMGVTVTYSDNDGD